MQRNNAPFSLIKNHFKESSLQALMAFLIPNQILATLLKEASLANIQSIRHALISRMLMDQMTHACHSRLKNADPKDTISLVQEHWNSAGQPTSQQSNTVAGAF